MNPGLFPHRDQLQRRPQLWRAVEPDFAIEKLLQDKLQLIETRIAELSDLRLELQHSLGQRCPLNP